MGRNMTGETDARPCRVDRGETTQSPRPADVLLFLLALLGIRLMRHGQVPARAAAGRTVAETPRWRQGGSAGCRGDEVASRSDARPGFLLRGRCAWVREVPLSEPR